MIASPEAGNAEAPVNVLVVDDRAENRAALRAILSAPQYRVVEASSGPDALLRLLEEEFAVLLIDVFMPGMNGLELAAAIRERERTATVPIVFLTAQPAGTEVMERGYQAGAVDYLVQPLAPEMVRAKVAVFAELHRRGKRIETQAALLVEAERDTGHMRLLELQLAGDRHYRSLAEAIPQIVWTARPDGFVDYFNQRWFEYTGLSAEATAGSWEGALHWDDVARCRDEWRDARREGRMFQAECRLRRASDLTHRWHLCRAVPEPGAMGAVMSWLGTFTDIEDQKQAQADLSEFKGTLDAVVDTVVICDPADFRLLYANQGASALLGQPPGELLQRSLIDLMADHASDEVRELVAPLRDGSKKVVAIETKFRRRNAPTVPVEVAFQLIRIDGGRVVAIARDITDRKRVQLERELLYREAVDAIRARDEFLSIASHELRTPLSTLQLQLQMLLRSIRKDASAPCRPDQTRTKLEMSAKQVERLTRLIGELMDFSKITAGRLRLESEELDLSATVRDVVLRLGDEATRAQCAVDLDARVPVVGRWDRMRVEQVVINLLTNAFKFGAGKPIELAVEEMGGGARLRVRDHGIGIAPEDVERIFNRYEQAASSRPYGGMGLGLYIARQIVEAHGGAIRVDSELGAGSTFTVELPREVKESTPHAGRADGRDEIARDGGGGEGHPDR